MRLPAVFVAIALASCTDTLEIESDVAIDEDPVTSFPGCRTIQKDQLYRCPSQALPASAELLYMKAVSSGKAVYAGSLAGTSLSDAYVFAEPEGWSIETASISPSRTIVLVTMRRPDCTSEWPNTAGTSCSWGRHVLWAGSLKHDSLQGTYYELVNLAAYYGRNSHIVGWHTWLTTKKALFNAKIVADGVTIDPDPQHGTGFAYTLDFEVSATSLVVSGLKLWGGNLVNSERCFVGRMHASMPPSGFGTACAAGQKVVFARRCYDDPVGPENFSWFNTVNYDGTGGLCKPESVAGPANLVPAFKNYVVDVDSACNPLAFDRNAPIRVPDYTGRYRHMGSNPEWGDGQPTISLDGKLVAFWSRKSSSASNTINNCAALESEDGTTLGNGADRVRVCVLGAQNTCSALVSLPEPTNPWFTQGGAYFHPMDNGNPGVFTSETDGTYVTDLVTRVRTRVLSGFGGYPILPAP
jgi:hypothetical protein